MPGLPAASIPRRKPRSGKRSRLRAPWSSILREGEAGRRGLLLVLEEPFGRLEELDHVDPAHRAVGHAKLHRKAGGRAGAGREVRIFEPLDAAAETDEMIRHGSPL